MVGIARAWLTEGLEFQVQVGSRIITSLSYPDLLWGLPGLLSNGYLG
jgi:hypothetical protein